MMSEGLATQIGSMLRGMRVVDLSPTLERGIRAIACDMAVVDGHGLETTGHTEHWLPNSILILEMLTNLDKLSLRSLFVATPLKIKDGLADPPAGLLRELGILPA